MPADATPWLLLLLALLAGGALALLLRLVQRVEALEKRLGAPDELAGIARGVQELARAHAELDLRRIEHVLIDLRDGQKRVEDRLLGALEAQSSRATTSSALEPVHQALQSTLPERIVTRLLALGYERIQFVTPVAEVQKLSAGDGEVAVEARRDGAPCKGRVVVRNGAIADLQLQSAYSIFP
ncbi:MAG: hypothetical protein U1F29_08540 [Planctomycetota bacterium]